MRPKKLRQECPRQADGRIVMPHVQTKILQSRPRGTDAGIDFRIVGRIVDENMNLAMRLDGRFAGALHGADSLCPPPVQMRAHRAPRRGDRVVWTARPHRYPREWAHRRPQGPLPCLPPSKPPPPVITTYRSFNENFSNTVTLFYRTETPGHDKCTVRMDFFAASTMATDAESITPSPLVAGSK